MNKLIPVITLTMAFGLMGYLALNSCGYMSVSDLKNVREVKKVVVMGNVTKGSVHFDTQLVFKINDGHHEVKVVYPKFVKLDNVSGYGTVVVEGIYHPENETILANDVQLRCPSKESYEIVKGVESVK